MEDQSAAESEIEGVQAHATIEAVQAYYTTEGVDNRIESVQASNKIELHGAIENTIEPLQGVIESTI